MPQSYAHYITFARSLALTTTLVLPACSSATSDGPTEKADLSAQTADAGDAGDAKASAAPVLDAGQASADAEVDGGRISGPLPPPEMPSSFV